MATNDNARGATPPCNWIVDDCPDSRGFWTIRRDNGTLNGDTEEQPIATVYLDGDADLIAEAPAMLEALRALLLQALQSELNSPANEWGWDAIQGARAILNRIDNPRP